MRRRVSACAGTEVTFDMTFPEFGRKIHGDLADINQAAPDSANGATIKPVIRMPQ